VGVQGCDVIAKFIAAKLQRDHALAKFCLRKADQTLFDQFKPTGDCTLRFGQ